MPTRMNIAPELVAEGKRLYERTLTPMRDIAAMMGISRRTLEKRARQWNWRPRKIASRPIELLHALRGAAVAVSTDPALPAEVTGEPVSAQRRIAIAERIQGVVERHLAAVERVLDVLGPSDQAEAERNSRTLAGLARTLREVAALNQPEQAPPDEAEDDSIPSDIDEFRRELARRINALIDARQRDANGGGGGTGAGPAAGGT
jgi:hypothetical protein